MYDVANCVAYPEQQGTAINSSGLYLIFSGPRANATISYHHTIFKKGKGLFSCTVLDVEFPRLHTHVDILQLTYDTIRGSFVDK